MREILFRGKRINSMKAGEWAEGFFMEWLNPRKNRKEARIQTISEGGCIDLIHEVDPSTVGQYTGLKDKNGKRIFEGDIVDCSEEWWDASGFAGHDTPILKVEWDEETCGFSPFSVYDSDCCVWIAAGNCIVLGNIHDNPELLEVR